MPINPAICLVIVSVLMIIFVPSCAPLDYPPLEAPGSGLLDGTNNASATPPGELTGSTNTQPGNAGFCYPGGLPGGFLVIGYLPEYEPFDINIANCLSDLIFFSLEPTPEGSLDTSRMTQERLDLLKTAKDRYGIRLHLSLGGWGRIGGFPEMVIDPARRQLFITELSSFLVANDFDGVDYDWEFPETPEEKAGYSALISETSQVFKDWGGLVTVTFYPNPELDLAPYLAADRIHIMSYDRDTRHATFEQATADLDLFLAKGVPADKLILGLPFYGRLMDPPFTPYTYNQIIQQFNPSPDMEEAGGIYYNGPAILQRKTCHAFMKGARGVMIWELGQDVQPGSGDEGRSLLRSVYEVAYRQCTE